MGAIRVGIIGLSAKPATWAKIAHLPGLKDSPHYQIHALCNSSLASTEEAIKANGLPSSTRAYADPEKLCADPDVDLVVISTRVDTHYALAKTALNAAKNVYVEWPLASNFEQAKELESIAKSKNVKTIVGLQGRLDPSVAKVKEIIESGRLGTIHSVDLYSAIGVWQNGAVGEAYKYFIDRAVGGNLLTIYGGHVLDTILSVHGELQAGYTTLLGNFRPRLNVLASDGTISKESYPKNTPDQMLLQGRFDADPAPVFSFHQRAGNKFTDRPGSTWRIYGDKAELLVEYEGAALQLSSPAQITICDGDTGEVHTVDVDQSYEELTGAPANIRRVYDAYAKGGNFADWSVALKRHELMEAFLAGDG